MCRLDRTRKGKKTREGVKSGVKSLERMRQGNGMKDREDKLSGVEILIVEKFTKINPNEPLRLSKQVT
jgi:hypothetical protein